MGSFPEGNNVARELGHEQTASGTKYKLYADPREVLCPPQELGRTSQRCDAGWEHFGATEWSLRMQQPVFKVITPCSAELAWGQVGILAQGP